MEPKIKNGTKVQLAIKSPQMIVVQPIMQGEGDFTGQYLCKWFDSKEDLKEGTFPEEALFQTK